MTLPSIIHIPEPQLEFRYQQKLVYPRDGLFLYGPVDEGKLRINYGVIGTRAGIARFEKWAATLNRPINPPPPRKGAKKTEPMHIIYPGFKAAFNTDWPEKPQNVISSVDEATLSKALHIKNRNEAIMEAVSLYVDPLVAACSKYEHLPDFWFVVIPEMVYELGRPQSKVFGKDAIVGKVTITKKEAKDLSIQPSLLTDVQAQTDVYLYVNHFRRQLKSRLLKHKIVTQLIRETTIAPQDFLKSNGQPKRRLEDPATMAWKLSTGAYYKAGGRPWQLAEVRDGVCYVGLTYKRREQTSDDDWACCAAQMFLSNGEGVVFRGALGPWYHANTKQFHIDEAAAEKLVSMVIKEYRDQHNGNPPKELFLHAKSSFTKEEWHGFSKGVPPETKIVGVQISDAKEKLKLFRPGKYPVIRGTALILDEQSAYLWTTGYCPRLDTYPGPETPNPLHVQVSRGECSINVVLSDILGLTKINFNSCLHNDRFPVTIKFADAVGDVILASPQEGEPKLPFKFYI